MQAIFLSSVFKKNKNYLGINRFKLLSFLTQKKIVALGGISKNNLEKLNLINFLVLLVFLFLNKKKAPKNGAFQIFKI